MKNHNYKKQQDYLDKSFDRWKKYFKEEGMTLRDIKLTPKEEFELEVITKEFEPRPFGKNIFDFEGVN